jgi:molecular chaperone GrpE
MEEDETQEAAAIEEQAVAPEDSPKRKLEGLAARVSELEDSLKAEKARSDDYYRRLQYLQADFENYRKRAEKEMGEVKRMGNERLLSDLLLVNDELELALQRAREKNENPALLEGVSMVHKRLQGLMAKEGVQRIAGVGSKFSPDLHDAALRVSSDSEEGTIIEEIRPGYLLKGRVLRPSIVKVAENQASEGARTDQEGEE